MQSPAMTMAAPAAAMQALDCERGSGRIQGPLAWAVCFAAIACATLFSKLSLPPFADRGITLSLLLLPVITFLGFAFRVLEFDPTRLTLFLLLTGALTVMSLFGVTQSPIGSLAMFTIVHLSFVFAAKVPAKRIHESFLNLSLVLACLGIAQLFLQYAVNPRFLFPIENFLPSSFVAQHFNSQGVVEYGSQTYRSNGVFLPEPSFFSQLMAVAIVLELSLHGRWHRLGVYGVGLMCAAAGTGIMILAVCVPLLIVKRARWDLLLAGALAVVAVSALGESSFAGHLAARTGEFNAVGSSAFARFVGGFYLFDQFLWDDPWRTLFGFGAGSFADLAARAHYPVAEMPLFKMVLEFGVLGALLYFLTVGYYLFSSPAPRIVSLAIAITFLLNGIYAAFGQALALGLLLWPYANTSHGAASAGGSLR